MAADGLRLFDAAFLVTRYRNEFALLEVPAVVRRIVIPIVYAFGAVLGKYRKFKDAPAPVVIAEVVEAS